MLGGFQRIMVVPSPDGSVIAVVQTTRQCKIQIEFLDALNNFSILSNFTISISDFSTISWINQTEILVELCVEYCGDAFYSVGVTEEPKLLDANYRQLEACLFTQTSSSFISRKGILIYIRQMNLIMHHISLSEYKNYTPYEDYYLLGCPFFNQ